MGACVSAATNSCREMLPSPLVSNIWNASMMPCVVALSKPAAQPALLLLPRDIRDIRDMSGSMRDSREPRLRSVFERRSVLTRSLTSGIVRRCARVDHDVRGSATVADRQRIEQWPSTHVRRFSFGEGDCALF